MINPYIFFQMKPVKKLHPKVKFTVAEDQQLIKLVEDFGNKDWNTIASKMENRNARQCRERWENYLSPTVNRAPFTPEEDLILLKKYQELGAKWVLISKSFNNRTDISVKSRWMVLKRRNITIESLEAAAETRSKAEEEAASNEMFKQHSEAVDKFLNRAQEIFEFDQDTWFDQSFWMAESNEL